MEEVGAKERREKGCERRKLQMNADKNLGTGRERYKDLTQFTYLGSKNISAPFRQANSKVT